MSISTKPVEPRREARGPVGAPPPTIQTSQKIRVGLIGAGGIASAHALSLSAIPGTVIAAIADPNPDRGKALADRFGVPNVYGSYQQMLEQRGLDVAHVLTPPGSHIDIAFDAIRAGCDVLVEKPLGLDSARCLELQKEADRLGRRVGVNHSDAHAPAFRRLVDIIASGRLGRVNHMAVTYAAPAEGLPVRDPAHFMFQSPGNMVFEFGPHPFSMIRLVMGELREISTIATGVVKIGGGRSYFHSWTCSMICARGTAQLAISLGRGLKEINTHVVCEDGIGFADSRRGLLQIYESTPHPLTESIRLALWNGVRGLSHTSGSLLADLAIKLKLKPYATPNGFSDSIRAFYYARASGRPLAEDAAAGAEVVRYCEAASAARIRSGT